MQDFGLVFDAVFYDTCSNHVRPHAVASTSRCYIYTLAELHQVLWT